LIPVDDEWYDDDLYDDDDDDDLYDDDDDDGIILSHVLTNVQGSFAANIPSSDG
jgi:hypothetical protein